MNGRIWALFVGFCLFLALLAGCFGPGEDEDGIDAEAETEGYDITIELADGSTENRHVTSDPAKADTDSDGMPDQIELLERLDPRSPDTDRDGLLDGHDVFLPDESQRAADWLTLGLVSVDSGNGTLQFLGERGTIASPRFGDGRDQDTDDDGLSDGEEVAGFEVIVGGMARTTFTLVHREDSDGDGLFDMEEVGLGTDPSLRDTDRDGVDDPWDLLPWGDLQLRFEVDQVLLTTDPEGRSHRDVWFRLQVPGESHRTRSGQVIRDDATSPDLWPATVLDVDDGGGNLRQAAHNFTFTLTALSESSSGELLLVDLFSETGNETSLFGRINALTGGLRITGPGGNIDQRWPANATFTGAHGSATLTFEVVP